MTEYLRLSQDNSAEGKPPFFKKSMNSITLDLRGNLSTHKPISSPPFNHPFQNKNQWSGGLNPYEDEWLCEKESIALYNDLIFISDSYDLLSPNGTIAELSYPSKRISEAEKKAWGKYHNRYVFNNAELDLIESDRFKFVSDENEQITFIVQWHRDQSNYFHWITEVLPKVYILALSIGWENISRIRFATVKYELKEYQLESLFSLLGNKQIKIEHFPSSTKFKRVIIAHSPSPGWTATKFLTSYVNRLSTQIHQDKNLEHSYDFSQPIYIERGQTNNIRMLSKESHQLLSRLITENKLQAFTPGEHSFNEQVLFFSLAQRMLGIHGAAFTNIIFCKPNSKVVEFFPGNYKDSPTYYLAGVNNIAWNRIICPTISDGIINLDKHVIDITMKYLCS